MPTITQNLPDTFSIEAYQKTFALRPVKYPDDMPLLYKWMHAEHVVDQWQLHLPMPQLKTHFEKMLADDHQRLYLILCDDKPIGYTEIYETARDRLSQYYKAKETDMGWHILLGDPAVVGKGYLKPTGMMISKFIFEHTEAKKIVVEPDSKVEVYQWIADSFAYRVQRLIEMPEKTASLYFCNRDEFFESRGYLSFYGATS
ncbi:MULTISPECIES: GNAT family N-acetyltransferase [unclassified Psychrobacter]|uniref:GNAT family N-acetyltransferase n=1 Tax=unclassified Psychrobacter TaxID=196806 RepID=UPI000869D8D3|nr:MULTISPECIES: GNAT family N-acetyltransferase [unclassified Psychrobacter]OEH66913.1 MAG: siderophore biosynthesis protein [Psychrobacter sp. B29-1]TEW88111.1 N-acetyltransferase [Psychrobacter sp. 230]|tara:strand:+ start:1513 stop:2115 length:603 start_codon:yes stop_codon:yes gene_type:complete